MHAAQLTAVWLALSVWVCVVPRRSLYIFYRKTLRLIELEREQADRKLRQSVKEALMEHRELVDDPSFEVPRPSRPEARTRHTRRGVSALYPRLQCAPPRLPTRGAVNVPARLSMRAVWCLRASTWFSCRAGSRRGSAARRAPHCHAVCADCAFVVVGCATVCRCPR